MTMMIITWFEKRSFVRQYGQPVGALWANDGNADDLVKAMDYCAENEGYRVHTFPSGTDYHQAKADSIQWRKDNVTTDSFCSY